MHKNQAPVKIFAGGKTVAFVDFKDIPEKDVKREPSIIVKSRGVIEFEYFDKPFLHKNEMWSYYSNNKYIDIKFIYYFLKINEPYCINDEDIAAMKEVELLKERTIQDYRSTYNDIRDWLRRERSGKDSEESKIDWDDVVFEIDLLKSQEISLDYILELIFEHNKKTKDKVALVEEARRVIRASIGNRAKESLVVDFIYETDLSIIQDKASIIDLFYAYANDKLKSEASELIADENLNEEEAKRYITASLKREFASENGTELNAILPKMSPLNPQYLTKKQSVFQKVVSFVEKFKGVGGQI